MCLGPPPPVSYMSNLVKDLQRSVEWAPAIGDRLAGDVRTLLTEEMNIPVLEEIKQKFPRPENLPELVAPVMNAELIKVVSRDHRENDRVLKRAHEYLLAVTSVVLGNLDMLEGGHIDQDVRTNTLTDGLAMLAKAMTDVTRARREVLKKDVRPEFKEILDPSKNKVGGDFLVGEDLAKKMEDLKQAHKTVDSLKPYTPGGWGQRPGGTNSPFFRGNRGGRGNGGVRGHPYAQPSRSTAFFSRGGIPRGRPGMRSRGQTFQHRGAR